MYLHLLQKLNVFDKRKLVFNGLEVSGYESRSFSTGRNLIVLLKTRVIFDLSILLLDVLSHECGIHIATSNCADA